MRASPRIGSTLPLFVLSFAMSPVSAQNLDADAINGTVMLDGDFLPDPYVIEIVPGGETQVGDLGANCSGFIFADQPDLKLELNSPAAQLGIFVSANIDTTLVVNDPSGNWFCSDDAEFLSNANPGVSFTKPASGIYDIWVGTYEASKLDATGKLAITEWDTSDWAGLDLGGDGTQIASTDDGVDFGDDLSNWANDGECDDPRFSGDGSASTLVEADRFHDATDCRDLYQRSQIQLAEGAADTAVASALGGGTQRGRLDGTDPVLAGNGYVDRYSYDGTAGATAVFDLQSAEFDTFLALVTPSGERLTNDDYDGSQQRSLLTLTLPETGEYQVEVSSYGSAETGGYTLALNGDVAAPETADNDYDGALEGSDSTYESGEYVDTWTFEGLPGQTVTIDLNSDDFDAYLVLETPDGEEEANDDADGGSDSNSRIVRQLSALGTYTVQVTSYAAGETGNYNLRIEQSSDTQQASVARDSVALALGQSLNGALEDADQRSEDNSFEDVYAFNAEAGEVVMLDLNSSDFDTYLSLVTPSGKVITNDDFDGRTDLSRLELALQESGRYRVLAGSYSEGVTGAYTLSLNSGNASDAGFQTASSNSSTQVFGIFAGMADYPGEDLDLELTDQDALRARDALIDGAGMRPENAYTLLNQDATNANFRDALATIGSQADADDMVVIFYSGHGSRVPRAGGPDSRDPDGLDESIELYDGSLLDDDLAALLDGVHAGTVLLVFDSCFSGGFAKDVVSAPGRMGLFSSEEDVTSQVAYKFQAGGYLAAFFDEAVRGHNADTDGDSELTAIELSQYLHDRYRVDVKSFGGDDFVRTGGPESSYQHLVVDRGGVAPYNVLFHH